MTDEPTTKRLVPPPQPQIYHPASGPLDVCITCGCVIPNHTAIFRPDPNSTSWTTARELHDAWHAHIEASDA